MNIAWIAVLTVAGAWSAAAPGSPTGPNPNAPPPRLSSADTLAALVRFEAPPGWKRTDYSNSLGADLVVSFENGPDRIALDVYGNRGSAYRNAAQFMKGPAATTMGKPPALIGSTPVAGKKANLYRRSYPLMDSDPHAPSPHPARMGRQLFCVLPPSADGRFVVLTYSRESPVPDPAGAGEAAWKSFLKSIQAPLPNP
ncbi:MAG: hypothetical protein KGL74_13055 [Elusimicrobia bacterium]|nr:hypothetical protein [Elusimicrobiota bacterium]MDE2512045.1 hypothetical protein [Elusimicrobiota bacterium]